ncbi:TPA: ATP-binding domain-containing protein [Candidatus Dojkabacteria bacterium]|uniref:ATP-binding domain-containing protein n=1 Tax=Candidatus Dojkabacteria bacterium TaxID=2099670 RepID=A0A832QHC1_9BACT|nr:ATP-binding domain-containing protein [Candidatus Dojkabacteria bacterium]
MQRFIKYIDPLYKDLEDIADFSDIKPKDDVEKTEYPHLEKITLITKKEIDKLFPILQRLEEELERQIDVIDSESDLDAKKEAKSIYNKILTEIERIVDRINNELITLDSPYFGKIVFQPKESITKKDLELYIGKFALVDEQTHIPLITDWRSPIANIYYQNSGPRENVSFLAPVGERFGNLKQKRQFQISKGRIRGIYDAKSGNVAADEFLLAQLQERIGKKLQDIVSTIQAQQNEIIRGNINEPILIQGVAGSGKTTILLHRLAYLFYTYSEEINDKNSLIIAPNQMFIDYVSDVLPNLGVGKVETLTYLFWGRKVLDWDKYYIVSNEAPEDKHKEYKGSIEFLNILDKYFEDFEHELLENIPSYIKESIAHRYYELKEGFKDIDMFERVSLATEYAFAQRKFTEYKEGKINMKERFIEETKKKILEYFKKKCNPYSLYKNLFRSNLLPKDISKYSLDGLTHKRRVRTYRIEDLAPIVYLHFKIHGKKDFERGYVMIDEAQDMSFVQLSTLTQIAKNGNLTLAGDLAQSIIPPFYIKDWDDVIKLVQEITGKECKYHQLQKCYRTTVEIIDFANSFFKKHFPKSYKLPEAVLRHGDDVKFLKAEKDLAEMEKDDIKEIINILKDDFKRGSVTSACLARDRQHANEIYDVLKNYADEIGEKVVRYDENNYQRGVLVMPIENAKGLEFDSVILADINSKYYEDTLLCSKLLYVGITRALHRLYVLVNKNDKFSKDFANVSL